MAAAAANNVRHAAVHYAESKATSNLTIRQVMGMLQHYHVADTAARIVQTQTLGWAILGTFFVALTLTITIVLWVATVRARQYAADWVEREKAQFYASGNIRCYDDEAIPYLVFGTVASGIITAVAAVTTYGNPWLWAGFFHPHLAFAHEVLQKFLR